MSVAEHAFWDRHGLFRGSDILFSLSHRIILNLPPACARSSHPLSAHAALQKHFLSGFAGLQERSEGRHRRESCAVFPAFV